MMASISCKINIEDFNKKIDQITERVKEAIVVGVNNVMEVMQEEASDIIYNYPESSWYVRTGNLGRNYDIVQMWGSETSYTAILTNRSNYFSYVELGTGKYAPGGRQTPWCYQTADGNWHWTSGMKGRHSMSQTFEKYKDKIKPYIVEEVSKVL
jgi:hypothetical protein